MMGNGLKDYNQVLVNDFILIVIKFIMKGILNKIYHMVRGYLTLGMEIRIVMGVGHTVDVI